MDNKKLYEKALKAIEDLFSDTSVPPEVTTERLEELRDEIKTMIAMLKEAS